VDTGTFTLLVFGGSVAAGLLGSLTGLGGGAVIIPLLVLVLGVDLRYAIGASLVAVIATSSGAAAAFIREGYTNIRLGMLLEVATTVGAIAGAWIAKDTPLGVIAAVFGGVLLWTAYSTLRPPVSHPDPVGDGSKTLGARLRLDSTYPTPKGMETYKVHAVPAGFGVMFLAGVLSALVGVGSGVVKVYAMDRLMRIPFKVSTTTSNFMIGVTAAASAGIYLHRGQIEPGLAMPVALGALLGSFVGARLLARMRVRTLRIIFALLVAVAGLQMIYRGATGAL